MSNGPERLKTDPDGSGPGGNGWQMYPLPGAYEIGQRLCVVGGCPRHASAQIPNYFDPGGHGYVVLCAYHHVLLVLLFGVFAHDPHVLKAAQEVANGYNIGWDLVLVAEPLVTCTPSAFVCLACGGRLMQTVAGSIKGSMYEGREWYHRCKAG